MQAMLIPVGGGRPIRIEKNVTVIGRKRWVCDICIDDRRISQLHCFIEKIDGLLFVRDLGSTNGTKINGKRVTEGALLPRDQLSIASAVFHVHVKTNDSDSSPEMPVAESGKSATPVATERFDDVLPVEVDSATDVMPLTGDTVD